MKNFQRHRRLRKTPQIRRLVEETSLAGARLIWPCFVVEGRGVREPIEAMPGQFRFSIDELVREVKAVSTEKVAGLLLFGVPSSKDPFAKGATAKDSLVARAVVAVKEASPNLLVTTDVCLCAYTDHGHCGVINAKGEIQNDASLEILAAMSLAHAEAGADCIAPSDMLDGRVLAIRRAFDANGFAETPIMSYAAKFASAFYGPFRDAAHSAPSFGDRKSYQMNPANVREAMREIAADLSEGADIVMVKPALPYLDVIAEARRRFDAPLAAYQVSGEYSMLKAAARNGWLNEAAAVGESLTAIRRAGADIILSYFAHQPKS